MRCFVLALALIGLMLIALPETSTHAADWRFSQLTDRAVSAAPDQSTRAPQEGAPAPDVTNANTNKDRTPATAMPRAFSPRMFTAPPARTWDT
jgi:hypothetical protein